MLYQRGVGATAVYQFKHALIQEAAYASLLRRTRQHYHQRIAQVLEAQFPDTVATQPELLAQHYTEAGLAEQAIPYWQRAGQHASERSANLEAISHFTTGMQAAHDPARDRRRVPSRHWTCNIALGAALMAKGLAAPEVEHAYTQAVAPCVSSWARRQSSFRSLSGLWHCSSWRRRDADGREIGQKTLTTLAQTPGTTPASFWRRTQALGATWSISGLLPRPRIPGAGHRHSTTRRHMRARVFRYGHDPGWCAFAYAAMGPLVSGLSGASPQVPTRPWRACVHPFSLALAPSGYAACSISSAATAPACP